MITYNFRYRGSYEYDKFVLNIFQFHNEVVILHDLIFQQDTDSTDNILGLKQAFDENYEQCIGDNSLSNQIYRQQLLMD